MTTEARPPWLVRQENGAVAEARTRALLMDRFWVLERSVDVDGADLIIQRRLTQRSLLDRTPPRLGFIQTKFYASTSTTQYVHREYVVDPHGKPRAEFFVVCHTGIEDNIRTFFLSAEEISSGFQLAGENHSKSNCFVLPGGDVLVQRFEIRDRRNALDQIDRALRNADFDKNRAFASWALPSTDIESPPILPMYEEQIDNWWGDIPNEFDNLRKQARAASWQLEDALSLLQKIQESQDPEQVSLIAQQLRREWGQSIGVLSDIYNPDFHTVVRLHKKRYQQLAEAGLRNTHAAIRRSVMDKFIKDVAPSMPLAKDRVYLIALVFDPQTWQGVQMTSHFSCAKDLWPEAIADEFGEMKDMPRADGIFQARAGSIEVYIAPGRYEYDKDFVNGKVVDIEGEWKDRLRVAAEITASNVLEQMMLDRFGECDSSAP